MSSAFNDLTVLQQKELGRSRPEGSETEAPHDLRAARRKSQGPGDDWTCTMTVITALPGFDPFLATPVVYDVSAKSDGCYKAEAPPSFVGQQLMSTPSGRSIVNPLYVIYGCFDTTARPPNALKARSANRPRARARTRPLPRANPYRRPRRARPNARPCRRPKEEAGTVGRARSRRRRTERETGRRKTTRRSRTRSRQI